MNPIRVLIVDDHPLILFGIRRSLEGREGFVVVGECTDLASTHAWLAAGGKAEVAILDRSLPDGEGLELVPQLKSAGMKVIVLTVEDDDGEIRAAIESGVDGYLLKSSGAEQIVHAIGIVLEDSGAFSPQVMQKLSRTSPPDPIAALSTREVEIAEHVAQGLSNKVIGARLNLSDNTVRNHLANIMRKLGLHNRVQVATLMLQHLKRNRGV